MAGIQYPANVGYSLGEEYGGATYVRLQMRYDNPDKLEGKVATRSLIMIAALMCLLKVLSAYVTVLDKLGWKSVPCSNEKLYN